MADRECREDAGVENVRGGERRGQGSIHGTSLSGLSIMSIVVCYLSRKYGRKRRWDKWRREARSTLPMILFTTVHVLWLRSVCILSHFRVRPTAMWLTRFTWSINKGECSIHRKGFTPSGICSSLFHILLLVDNSDKSVYMCSNSQFAYVIRSPVLPTSEKTAQLPTELLIISDYQ